LAIADRNRPPGCIALEVQTGGQIPFKRLKVFNAFKEPAPESDWYQLPRRYFAATTARFERPEEAIALS
jgi:hypothetical protein